MSELKNQELPLLDVQGAVIPKDLSREYLQAPENSRTLGLIERIAVRERQLSAALNELKAKDESFAHAQRLWREQHERDVQEIAAKDTELAAKDARIAELAAKYQCNPTGRLDGLEALSIHMQTAHRLCNENYDWAKRLEGQLGAVSEVLKEKLSVMVRAGGFYYYKYPDINDWLARLRSIVEGK